MPAVTATAASEAIYECRSGNELTVSFDAERTAHLEYDGQLQSLTPVAAAQGAAYANVHYRLRIADQDGKEQAVLMRGEGIIERCTRESRTAIAGPGLAPCRPEMLDLAPGDEDAGMGHRQKTFVVTLKGDRACLLPSWPAVKSEPVEGGKAPSVRRTTDSYFGTTDNSGRKVLEQGKPLNFYLGWSVTPRGNRTMADCPAVVAVRLMAPAGGESASVPVEIHACGGTVNLSPFMVAEKKDDAAGT